MTRVRAAIVQDAPVAFDREATLEKLAGLLDRAAEAGAELVVFPEAFVSGYPKGFDFGAVVGARTPAGRALFQRYHASALDVPGPALDWIAERVRRAGVHVVLGVIERERGTLYCTVLFLGPDGTLLGKHRKVVPTAMERLIWGQGDGSTLTAVKTPLGTLGSVICWENYMPFMRVAMYARGVELYCAPTVDDREVWVSSMRHIAVEGRCFVLSACQFARRGDYPADVENRLSEDPDATLIRGGSLIADPFGELLAGPVYDKADILVADLDLARIPEGKFDLDVVGHYSRPDIFTFAIDETPRGVLLPPSERERE